MSKKIELFGSLVRYGDKSTQVFFRNGTFKRHVIFLGGLSDGLLATRYIEPLAQALTALGWSFIQPVLSSSWSGYGMATLDQDASEIEQLIRFVIEGEGSEGVFLIGHSTGCQDIVHYLRTGTNCTGAVRGAILQAPVSDREYLTTLPGTKEFLEVAEKMIAEGRKNDVMPLDANHGVPITAFRYHSLAGVGGEDDMFSSDLTMDELVMKLGHMARIQTQVICSMADEYMPDHVDKKVLLDRLCQAMGGAEKVAIEGGLHDLSNRVAEAVKAMVDFIKTEGCKGWDDPWS